MSEVIPGNKNEFVPSTDIVSSMGDNALRSDGFQKPKHEFEGYAAKVGDVLRIMYDDSTEETVCLVESGQYEQQDDAVSETSPLGAQLLNAVVGMEARWRTPNGRFMTATVLEITPQS